MTKQPNNKSRAQTEEHGSLGSYVTGFILSVGLTLLAYFAVVHHWYTSWTLAVFLLILAVAQFIVQMVLFLNIDKEDKPRDKQLIMNMMIIIVLILVVGTVWIMHNLDNRMMPSTEQMEEYNKGQIGF